MRLISLSPKRPDVAELLRLSSEYVASLYPSNIKQLEGPEELARANVCFIGAFAEGKLVGIGAAKTIREQETYGEIKRLYVLPEYRGQGVSRKIMDALEQHLAGQGISLVRLETGVRQTQSIGLYTSAGYSKRAPFGEYKSNASSVFMEKELISAP